MTRPTGTRRPLTPAPSRPAPSRPAFRRSLLSIAVGLAVVLAPSHHAQAQNGATAAGARKAYDIPAGPLEDALKRFGREAGILLSFPSEIVDGRSSRGLHGDFAAGEGLDRLLAGSGLEAVRGGGGEYTLRRLPPAGSGDTVLPAITVSGKAPGSTTEGTGSYTTWSTSSSTRLNLSPQETPQAITILTRQRLDDQRLDTLTDALDATPGIIVQRPTVGEDSPDIYARGSYLRNYQIDGVPTSAALSPYLANTAAYDRIEVVRGATGIMSGLGTPAATINLIRKRPTSAPQASITAQAGTWDRQGIGLDVSRPMNEAGTAHARLVADYNRQGAWVDRFDQKNLAVYGIGELDLSEHTLLSVGFNHLSQDTRSPVQGRPLFFSNGRRIPLSPADNDTPEWRYYDHESTGLFASVEHRFGAGWVGKIEYSHTQYRYDAVVNSITGSIDPITGNGTELWLARWSAKPEQDNLDAYVSGVFSLFGRDHELIAGVTLSKLRSNGPSYVDDWENYPFDFNIFDWADTAPAPTFFDTGKSSSDEHQHSAYLSTRFQLGDATSLLLGSRITRWKLERRSLDHDTGARSASKRNEDVSVPYVGIVHALNDTWSIYGSYTRIFQPQESRIFQYLPPGSSPDPEQGQGYEVGAKASFGDGRLISNLSLFQTDVENLAIWNGDAFRYDVQGQTKTRGVEFEIHGELAPRWQASTGYSLVRIEDEDGRRTLTRLPTQSFKAFTTYRLPGTLEGLTIGGGLNWQNAVSSNYAIDHKQGSVTLVNLMALYELDRNLSVSLHLNNALDKRYFSTVANNYGTFGAPRNFTLTARYTF